MLKDNQNPPFPLILCCAKPEKAMTVLTSSSIYLLQLEKYKKTVK